MSLTRKLWEYANFANGKWRFYRPYIKPGVEDSIACRLLDEVGSQILAFIDVYCAISVQVERHNNGALLLTGHKPCLDVRLSRRDSGTWVEVTVYGNHTLITVTFLEEPARIEWSLEDPDIIDAIVKYVARIFRDHPCGAKG